MKQLLICLTILALFGGLNLLDAHARSNDRAGLFITADMQFDYAQTLFDQKDFIAAQVEFKRFIHFFPKDPRHDRADYTAGVALFRAEQYYEAAKRFDTIIRQSKDIDNPWARQSGFMQSQAFEAMGNPGYARIVLQNYLKLTRDIDTKDRIYLELARMHIQNTATPGKDELDSARKNLMLISPEKQREYNVTKQLEAINNAVNAPTKNPVLAGILAIIPGGGMLYCERYKDAFISFCFNTGLIWAAYTAFDHDNPALGGVITFLETGFYSGNIYGSITAAHKYNKAAQIKILNKTFDFKPGFDPVNKSFFMRLTHGF
jgi:tetratricopeptide (TPR) repeat protein